MLIEKILKCGLLKVMILIDVYLYICLLFPAANVYYVFVCFGVFLFGLTLFHFDVHRRSE